jgi:general L-amino acid transport system substrate-binding protein
MLKRLLPAALLSLLAACGDPGSAVDEPAPGAQTVPGTPAASGPSGPVVQGATLKAMRGRKRLNCGVNVGLVGFAYTDNKGEWRGFDVDFCKATAAAVFGDPKAVRFMPMSATERFTALQSGEVDVLWRNTSWTYTRDADNRLDFSGINYYDGQGFLVRRSLRLTSATELNGARICVQTGSTTELNLADYFRSKGLKYNPIVVDSDDAARANYVKEACDAYTADISELAAIRSLMDDPNAHVILPEVISKEALGPVVRQGDDQWGDIVRWTLYALILAEEHGVTAANVDQMRKTSTNPEVRRLLGVEGGFGRMLGLNDDWAYRAIKAVGNYGEVFDRNVGRNSALKLDRGLNALWSAPKPGLMFAPPMR